MVYTLTGSSSTSLNGLLKLLTTFVLYACASMQMLKNANITQAHTVNNLGCIHSLKLNNTFKMIPQRIPQ